MPSHSTHMTSEGPKLRKLPPKLTLLWNIPSLLILRSVKLLLLCWVGIQIQKTTYPLRCTTAPLFDAVTFTSRLPLPEKRTGLYFTRLSIFSPFAFSIFLFVGRHLQAFVKHYEEEVFAAY